MLMRIATMRRITMIRSKREANRCIFQHSWRRFWIKKDLLANQVNWKAKVVLSCSWEDIINSSIFRYITWPGQALGYKVVLLFLSVALSSEHGPQTPAYASTQCSKEVSSGIYISEEDSAHNQYQKRWHRNMYRVTHRRDSCMKGLGSARRRSWG